MSTTTDVIDAVSVNAGRSRDSQVKKRPAPRTAEKAEARARVGFIDAVRGFAVVIMVIYHFSFDLNQFGVIHQNFNYDLFWLSFRSVIVTFFATLVGVSLVLASSKIESRGFWKRQLKLAVCAGLVTVSSYVMFPQSYIYFGVLHFIFVMSFVGRPVTSLVVGVASLVAGLAISHPAFDWGPLNWIGLMTHKPITEDYVPLFPWGGLVLIGIAIGHLWKRLSWNFPAPEALQWAGRNSLEIYILHQPILVGLLSVIL